MKVFYFKNFLKIENKTASQTG